MPKRPKKKRKYTNSQRTVSLPMLRDIDCSTLISQDEGECPLCQAKMSIGDIPRHIERGCPPVKPQSKSAPTASGNQKSDWKKVFAGAGGNKAKE